MDGNERMEENAHSAAAASISNGTTMHSAPTDAAADSTPAAAPAASSTAAASAAPRSRSDGQASDMELTLYRWQDKHQRNREWMQPKRRVELPITRNSGDARAVHPLASCLDQLSAQVPTLRYASSSEWGTDEDESLRNHFFLHSEYVPAAQRSTDGVDEAHIRKRKVYVCVFCSRRYKQQCNFLAHVHSSHESSAADLLAALGRKAAKRIADEVHEAENSPAAMTFYVEAVQTVVAFQCKLCEPSKVTGFDSLSEMSRHVLVDHMGQPPPAAPASAPQHRSSTRAPLHRALSGSNSDDEDRSKSNSDDDEPARCRVKHTPSRFDKPAANGASAGSAATNGRKRKSAANTNADPEEDGSAVKNGVHCSDCSFVFPSKNRAYRRHRQGHNRLKEQHSRAQQHMTDAERAAYEAAHAGEMNGLDGGLRSKPMTRQRLAAVTKHSDDEDGAPAAAAEDDSDSDSKPLARRRNAVSHASLTTSPNSPVDLRVQCPSCKRNFAREADCKRHDKWCKGKAEQERNSDEGSEESDEDDEGTATARSNGRAAAAETSAKEFPCQFCAHVSHSRTSFYSHKKRCEKNPNGQMQETTAADVKSSSPTLSHLLAAGEHMRDAEAAEGGAPAMARQRSVEKREGRPPLQAPLERAQTEPGVVSSTAAAPSRQRQQWTKAELTCKLCFETFTHPFSVARHAEVHDVKSGDHAFTCPHCDAPFGHSQRFKKHVQMCAKRTKSAGAAAAAGEAVRTNGNHEAETNGEEKQPHKRARKAKTEEPAHVHSTEPTAPASSSAAATLDGNSSAMTDVGGAPAAHELNGLGNHDRAIIGRAILRDSRASLAEAPQPGATAAPQFLFPQQSMQSHSFAMNALPPYMQPMAMQLGASYSDAPFAADFSNSLSIQGRRIFNTASLSPASAEVAMAAAGTLSPQVQSSRAETSNTGMLSPASAAFNMVKAQAARAPAQRAASTKAHSGAPHTPAPPTFTAAPPPPSVATNVPASALRSMPARSTATRTAQQLPAASHRSPAEAAKRGGTRS